MLTYLLVNLFSVAIPFIYSFNKRLNFYKTWYAFWPAVLMTGAVFIYWDVYFTEWGVWGFNPRHLMGINLINLPLEEWLFFICIPYACVFTYHCLNILLENDYLSSSARIITVILIVLLFLVAGLNLNRLYTSVTFISTAIFLLLHLLVFKSEYLGRFYLAYIIIFLMPFMLVNGILTGSFIPEEVVWYNNTENLGIRVFTIPIEDFVYGMLLILMNVTIYESLIAKREKNRVVNIST